MIVQRQPRAGFVQPRCGTADARRRFSTGAQRGPRGDHAFGEANLDPSHSFAARGLAAAAAWIARGAMALAAACALVAPALAADQEPGSAFVPVRPVPMT